jgi:hypothetical protein
MTNPDVESRPRDHADPARPDHARLGLLLPIRGLQTRTQQLRLVVTARWLITHRWTWKDFRRHYTDRSGRWEPLSAGEVRLFDIGSVPVCRYRYAATATADSRSPCPGPSPTTPNDSDRGEHLAVKARTAGSESGLGTPASSNAGTARPRPTQLLAKSRNGARRASFANVINLHLFYRFEMLDLASAGAGDRHP